MYSSKLNTDNYSFCTTIQITSCFSEIKTCLPIKLDFNENNFNFNLVREDGKDIRFSEVSNGDCALFYWIAEFSFANKIATLWISVPQLLPGETKTIFVFFGNPYDVGDSNPNNLEFKFVYVFNSTPLSSAVWEGAITNQYNSLYGYRTYYSYNIYNYFTVINHILENTKSHEVYIGFYYHNNTPLDMWECIISYLGGENQVDFLLYWNKTVVNSEYTDVNKSYTQQAYHLESDSYNEFYSGYQESTDTLTWSFSKRNTYEDVFVEEFRKVEGNTTASTVGIRNGSYHGNNDLYVRWIVVQEYIGNYIVINTDELYLDNSDINSNVLFNTEPYSLDLTNVEFYHQSDCGGDPIKLSDNDDSIIGTWDSDSGVSQGSICIDFVRRGSNLVNKSYLHFDSSHVPYYNASKLSDYGIDRFDRNYWQSKYLSGWACIKFDLPQTVSCLGLMALPTLLNGMVKNFIFYGGYDDPRFVNSSWVVLYEGVCEAEEGWQQFYFNNRNLYKYYKLEVLDTYGLNVCIKEWNMYNIDIDLIDGYVINQIRLLPSKVDSNESYFPKEIQILGSNDFLNWELLLSSSTYNPYRKGSYGYWQRYNITNDNKYRAYKLNMNNNWGNTNDKFVLAEWEMVMDYEESVTDRLLPLSIITSSENVNIWASISASFESGWVYLSTDSAILKLYNFRLSDYTSISGTYLINDVIVLN